MHHSPGHRGMGDGLRPKLQGYVAEKCCSMILAEAAGCLFGDPGFRPSSDALYTATTAHIHSSLLAGSCWTLFVLSTGSVPAAVVMLNWLLWIDAYLRSPLDQARALETS